MMFILADSFGYHGMSRLIAEMKRAEALAIQARGLINDLRQVGFLPCWN